MINADGWSDRPLKTQIVEGRHFKLEFPQAMLVFNRDTGSIEPCGSCQDTKFVCRKCAVVVEDILKNGFTGIAERDPALDVLNCGPGKLTQRLNAILECPYLVYDFPF